MSTMIRSCIATSHLYRFTTAICITRVAATRDRNLSRGAVARRDTKPWLILGESVAVAARVSGIIRATGWNTYVFRPTLVAADRGAARPHRRGDPDRARRRRLWHRPLYLARHAARP